MDQARAAGGPGIADDAASEDCGPGPRARVDPSRDLVAISPSGVAYDVLAAKQIGVYDLTWRAVDAPLAPSTELPLHLAVYAAPARRQ